jgi:hypothetical protein
MRKNKNYKLKAAKESIALHISSTRGHKEKWFLQHFINIMNVTDVKMTEG